LPPLPLLRALVPVKALQGVLWGSYCLAVIKVTRFNVLIHLNAGVLFFLELVLQGRKLRVYNGILVWFIVLEILSFLFVMLPCRRPEQIGFTFGI
jgi:hypothetical protein